MDIENKEELDQWLFEHAHNQGHVCNAIKGDVNGEMVNVAWEDVATREKFYVLYAEQPQPSKGDQG